jgi:hypothetical protein
VTGLAPAFSVRETGILLLDDTDRAGRDQRDKKTDKDRR